MEVFILLPQWQHDYPAVLGNALVFYYRKPAWSASASRLPGWCRLKESQEESDFRERCAAVYAVDSRKPKIEYLKFRSIYEFLYGNLSFKSRKVKFRNLEITGEFRTA
jgi:hypothetical protein